METNTTTNETMPESPTVSWEKQIADLLAKLSQVQGDLLSLLDEKRVALAAGEYKGLEAFSRRETELIERLEACHADRQALLVAAAREGLPSESVQSLAQALPADARENIGPGVSEARRKSRLLQHHSLTNWVVVQRTLIHLSQMIEIIATGGRMKPTYGKNDSSVDSGALVDHCA